MGLRYAAFAAILVLGACTGEEPEPQITESQHTAPTSEPKQTAEPSITDGISAETIIHLSEEDRMEVGEMMIEEPQLFRTEAEWTAWWEETAPEGLGDLPRDMREPVFDGTIAVAGSYHRCTEYSYLSQEDGEIFFHIATDEEHIDCAWAPNQFVVYEITYEELGINDPDDVTMHPAYISGHER